MNRTIGKPVSRGAVVETHVLFRGDSLTPDEIVNRSWQDRKGLGGIFERGRNLNVADYIYDMSRTGGYILATDKL